jgi:PAS domain S-box-containing protein
MAGGEDGDSGLKSDAGLRPGGDLTGLYAAIIESSDDAVVGLASDGTIVSWNPASERLFGFSEAEAIGRPVHITAGEEHLAELDDLLARIARGEHVRHYETERVKKSGERVPVSITLSPIHGPEGSVVGASKITRDMTDRKLADDRIKEALAYAEGIVETVRMPLIVLDGGLAVRRANRAFYCRFDATPDGVEGRRIYDLGNREWDIPDLRRLLEEILPQERTLDDFKVEHDFERLGRREMRLNARRLEQDGGGAGLILLSIEDVTERRAAETQVRFQSHLLEAVGQAVIASDPAGTVLYWNKAAEDLYGWSKAEADGRNVADLVVAPEASAEAEGIMERLRTGKAWSGEFPVRRRDGSVFPAFVTDAPIVGEDGRLEAVVGVSADLTDRKRAEAARRESEGRLRTLTDNLPDGAIYQMVQDSGGRSRFTFVSGGVERLFGVKPEAAIADPAVLDHTIHERDRGRVQAAEAESLRTLKRFDCEFRHTMPDGEIRWVHARSAPRRLPDGVVWEGVLLDITDRKRAESEAAAATAKFEAVFEQSPFYAGITTPDGTLTDISRSALEQCGYRREDVIGRPFWETGWWHGSAEVREKVRAGAAAAAEGRPYAEELPYYLADGEERLTYFRLSPVRDASGRVAFLLPTGLDITDRKRTEAALRESEQRSRTILESVTDAFYAVDREWRFTYLNHEAERLLGRTRGDLVGKQIWEEFAPAVETAFYDAYHRAMAGTETVRFEVLYPPHDKWYEVHAYPSPDGIAVYFRDITERRQVDQALRESEARLRRVVESNAVGLIVADFSGRLIEANDAFLATVGYTHDDLASGRLNFLELTPPEYRSLDEAAMSEMLRSGRHESFEKEYVRKDQTRVPVLVGTAYLGKDGEGNDLGVGFIVDLSRQKSAEQALRASERRLQRLFEANVVGVGVSDGAGNWVEANDELLRMLGYDRTELQAGEVRWKDMTPDRYLPLDEQAIAEAVERGACTPYEKEYIRKDGSLLPVLLGYATLDEPDRFVCFVLDLTRMRKVSDALKQSEERFRGLMDQAPFSVQILSPDGRTVRVNRAWEELWGLTLDQLADYNVLEDPQLEAKGVARGLRKAFGGEPATLPEIAYDPNQSLPGRTSHEEPVRWISAVAYPIKDAAGTVREVALVHEDITARRKAEAGLRESEERFRAIVQHSVAGVGEADLSGRFTFVNDRYCEILGRSREELLAGLQMQDVTHPEDLPRNLSLLERLVEDGTPFQLEKRYVQPDGRVVWVGNSVSGVRDAAGRVKSIVAVSVDVTDRKRAEVDTRFLADASAALADLSDPASTLTKVAGMAVPHFADWCAIDLLEDGALRRVAVAHVDPAKAALAHELHRLMPQDLNIGWGVARVLNTGDSELVPEVTDDLLKASVRDPALFELARELGMRSYVGVPLTTRGRVHGTLTFAAGDFGRAYDDRDLALAEDLARRAAVALENARLYSEVRDAARRKDEFLAMLAHELRNPLAPIRSGLDLLKLSDAEPEVVEVMSDQVGHVVRLVDDLLDVSRILRGKVELKKVTTDLAAVLRRAVEAVRPRTEEHAQQLTAVLPDWPLRIDADPVRLTQVVTNLLNNASKYTDDGGNIRLEASHEGGDVVIRVRDSGIGIDPKLLPRIFELFTQADQALDRSQGGLGIGLTVVKSLVEMHGGSVTASSEGHGRGSEFVIRLPAAEPAELSASNGPAAAPAGPLRILVVDDNAPAAKLLGRLLERLGGHEIRIAHDGEAALVEAEAFRPDLVLLDIGLPRMDGFEVARRLRERPGFSDVLLVALTGYGTAEDRRRSLEAGFDEHLVKPPGVEMLRTVLAHPKLRQ